MIKSGFGVQEPRKIAQTLNEKIGGNALIFNGVLSCARTTYSDLYSFEIGLSTASTTSGAASGRSLPGAVKRIYRHAIDPRAGDGEGGAWWAEVAAEVHAVIEAPDVATASAVISWWHHDWSMVGDTPGRAAKRMRTAAARVKLAN